MSDHTHPMPRDQKVKTAIKLLKQYIESCEPEYCERCPLYEPSGITHRNKCDLAHAIVYEGE